MKRTSLFVALSLLVLCNKSSASWASDEYHKAKQEAKKIGKALEPSCSTQFGICSAGCMAGSSKSPSGGMYCSDLCQKGLQSCKDAANVDQRMQQQNADQQNVAQSSDDQGQNSEHQAVAKKFFDVRRLPMQNRAAHIKELKERLQHPGLTPAQRMSMMKELKNLEQE